ncbi:MAG TPA: hypothetical protein VFW62_06450, partial [bacterium]|nr:hypothetical protein [bacterium]
LAEIFSAKPPTPGRRFTLVWREGVGGQVQFLRDGEAIRAEWKAPLTPQQTYWYLPSPLVMGQFQFVNGSQYATYGWEAEPGYSRNMEQRLSTLWTNMGVVGSFEKAAGLEEGAERRGALLARLAQHWVLNEGNTKPLSPPALTNLLLIHRTLEQALAHLELGLVRRFQERLSHQTFQSYQRAIEGIVLPAGDPKLLPLSDKLESLTGENYLPLYDGLRAAFVRQLFHGLNRPRFPLENYRLLRDPRRLGEIYRDTALLRLKPILDVISNGHWNYLMSTDLTQLTDVQRKQRRDIEFLLGEIPDHARILTGHGRFHREFLHGAFEVRQVSWYQVFHNNLKQLPEEMQSQYRVQDLPSRKDIQEMLIMGSTRS